MSLGKYGQTFHSHPQDCPPCPHPPTHTAPLGLTLTNKWVT